MLLADNETKVDLLNTEVIAATIVKMLKAQPEQPMTVGVHGDWGAGKSSVLEMIDGLFGGDDDTVCIKFNSWRFQGFEDAKIALIEGIVTELLAKRPMLTKATDAVMDVVRHIDLFKLARKTGSVALAGMLHLHGMTDLHAMGVALANLATDPGKLATKENLEKLEKSAKDILKTGSSSPNIPEEISAFRKAFDSLLDKANIKHLVVLIDDLDRCLPKTAIETLEAVRLFLFARRTAFVISADEAMIEYAVHHHFPDLPETPIPNAYARSYLEKLIQVPFRIPALGVRETRIYVMLLLVGADIGEDEKSYTDLIGAAREHLKRPWIDSGLEAAEVMIRLGTKATEAQAALTLSEQIGPILATGTKGNPRQIKRFLNTLLLRRHTAEARGFGNEIKRPVLAKLMLAERFLPRLYEQVANSAVSDPSGLCRNLKALEDSVTQTTTRRLPKATTRVADGGNECETSMSVGSSDVISAESPILQEWLMSAPIREWANVSPAIGGEDLRPYLFVSKERYDSFGSVSHQDPLAGLIQGLFADKLAVQRYESELSGLSPSDVAHVFDAVRARIVTSDKFKTKPSGIDGLCVLVKAHPSTQGQLLDLLAMLPAERIGTWVCSGWGDVIKDASHLQRLDGLLSEWSSQTKNEVLRKAATAVLQAAQRSK